MEHACKAADILVTITHSTNIPIMKNPHAMCCSFPTFKQSATVLGYPATQESLLQHSRQQENKEEQRRQKQTRGTRAHA